MALVRRCIGKSSKHFSASPSQSPRFQSISVIQNKSSLLFHIRVQDFNQRNVSQRSGGLTEHNVATASFMLVEKKICTIPTARHRPIFVTDDKGFPCAKGVMGYRSLRGSTTKQVPGTLLRFTQCRFTFCMESTSSLYA